MKKINHSALLRNEYRFFLGVDFNEERFCRDFVDLIETALLFDFFTLFFLDRRGFLPLLDLERAAALRATFLPRIFLFVILLDLERGRNNCKHDGQIISAEVSSPSNANTDAFPCNPNLEDGLKDSELSFPSNATADAFFCNPNLDAGLKDC
ncbi:hypothetical protein T4D_11881 [Trichinella pseudospiralis]|uniref:Uncharacterized protein n=1 Tax=Trichinella pseudospiralis TaxID=6337 RepID=A0A0V1FEI5_TRIPS|nr:hypothetical protein T4D_11881 [Trichinella pseudospiralis]